MIVFCRGERRGERRGVAVLASLVPLLPLLFILTLCLTIIALTAKRNFRNNETDALRNDIKSACADMTLSAGANARQAEDLVAMYNIFLTDCLDKHAPWRNVRVRDNTPHPLYDSDIDDAREKKRKLENVWRKAKLEIHRQLYVT